MPTSRMPQLDTKASEDHCPLTGTVEVKGPITLSVGVLLWPGLAALNPDLLPGLRDTPASCLTGHSSNCLFPSSYSSLFESQLQRGVVGRGRDRFPICWFSPQAAGLTRNLIRVSMGVQGPKPWASFCCFSYAH